MWLEVFSGGEPRAVDNDFSLVVGVAYFSSGQGTSALVLSAGGVERNGLLQNRFAVSGLNNLYVYAGAVVDSINGQVAGNLVADLSWRVLEQDYGNEHSLLADNGREY